MRVLILVLFLLMSAVAALLPGSFIFGTLIPREFLHLVGYENLLLIAHLGAYGGLVVIAAWVWGRLVPAAAGVFLFSVAIAGLQTLIPWREGGLRDVLLNLGAVLLGVLAVLLIRGVRRYLLPGVPTSKP
jgi:VanZ family protein